VSAAITPSSVVVDTNVVSFVFKGDSRAELYRLHLNGRLLVISFMTVAELDRWALERNWGAARRARMEQHLRNFVIYPFDRALCLKWAEATTSARRKGYPIESADAWIAATALVQGIPLVTHNPADFQGVDGLVLISEV
jgi:predicted nucleic acid-binding protein